MVSRRVQPRPKLRSSPAPRAQKDAQSRACAICKRKNSTRFTYCSTRCKVLARKIDQNGYDWYGLQLEVAKPLQGKILGGPRRGEYADVETLDHVVECKWSSLATIRVKTAWVEKTQRLAKAYRRHPVLVIGMNQVRVAFFLDDDLYSYAQFLPVLKAWYVDGYQVWVGGYSGLVIPAPFKKSLIKGMKVKANEWKPLEPEWSE